nr:hypothetical protein HmN_000902600 [Hymenolepis microstoma]
MAKEALLLRLLLKFLAMLWTTAPATTIGFLISTTSASSFVKVVQSKVVFLFLDTFTASTTSPRTFVEQLMLATTTSLTSLLLLMLYVPTTGRIKTTPPTRETSPSPTFTRSTSTPAAPPDVLTEEQTTSLQQPPPLPRLYTPRPTTTPPS